MIVAVLSSLRRLKTKKGTAEVGTPPSLSTLPVCLGGNACPFLHRRQACHRFGKDALPPFLRSDSADLPNLPIGRGMGESLLFTNLNADLSNGHGEAYNYQHFAFLVKLNMRVSFNKLNVSC